MDKITGDYEKTSVAADALNTTIATAQNATEEASALEELRKVQKKDFIDILKAMDGLPVTVRLLDPPLHEFLPNVHELEIEKATLNLPS